jgi:hypothetical protein
MIIFNSISFEFFSAEFRPPNSQNVSPKKEVKIPSSTVKDAVIEKPISFPTGAVILTIHKGRDLERKGKFGKADPYVVLNTGKEKFKTNTVKNNHNPVWNYTVKFDLHKESSFEILLAVYDEDIGKDDSLGNAKLSIKELIKKQRLVDKWIPLKDCKSGEILISAEFLEPSELGTERTSLVPRRSIDRKTELKLTPTIVSDEDDGFESESLPPTPQVQTPWSVIAKQPSRPSGPTPPDHLTETVETESDRSYKVSTITIDSSSKQEKVTKITKNVTQTTTIHISSKTTEERPTGTILITLHKAQDLEKK